MERAVSIGVMCVALYGLIAMLVHAQGFSLGQVEQTTGTNLGSQCFQQLRQFGCDRGGVVCTPRIGGNGKGGEGGGLNPEFACRLVAYFRAHPNQRIVSAYRSAAKQQSMCGSGGKGCLGAGKSCHQYGLAVDVSNLHLAEKQTERGLIRAYSGPHLQCQENSTASCDPQTVPCSGKSPNNDPAVGAGQEGGQGQQGGGQGGQGQDGQQGDGGGGESSGGGAADQPAPEAQPQSQEKKLDQSNILPMYDAQLTCRSISSEGKTSAQVAWKCPSGMSARVQVGRVTTTNGAGAVVVKSALHEGERRVALGSARVYTLACIRNTQVLATSACTVEGDVKATPLSPALTVSASEKEITVKQTTMLRWKARGVTSGSCVVTGPNGFEVFGNAGESEVGPLRVGTHTFTLVCGIKGGGSVSEDVEITVRKSTKEMTPVRVEEEYESQSVELGNPLERAQR